MEQSQVPNDPLSRFSLSIFTVNGLLLQSGEIITRPLGQSSARWQVLGHAAYQPQTVSQMARSIGNTRQSVQRIANALSQEGLVAYKDNPVDRRAQLVKVTPKGEKVLAEIYARDQAWSQHLIGKLNPQELVEIANALEAIGRTLENHMKTVKVEKAQL